MTTKPVPLDENDVKPVDQEWTLELDQSLSNSTSRVYHITQSPSSSALQRLRERLNDLSKLDIDSF